MQKRIIKILETIIVPPIVAVLFINIGVILNSCSGEMPVCAEEERAVNIMPDYSGITIPPNIAPLNFTIKENGEKYLVRFYEGNGESLTISSSTGTIRIPEGKWKRLLQLCTGKKIFIDIFVKKDGVWIKFPTILNTVAVEPIDSYLTYRLIEPGFESWNKMGIYQRCLENFTQNPVMINDMSDDNCMNCHSFCRNNSHTMMFHMRAKHSGTVIYRKGKLTKVNTKTNHTISPGVYPAWHPGGRYIAFSVNHIGQAFHAIPRLKIEVTDTLSDLMVFDAEKNKVFTSTSITYKDRFETFPTWSPDGKYLYFCSAKALPETQFEKIRYDLLRISFDTLSHFGSVDTIVSAAKVGRSVSFPRISPDGKILLFCMSDYGNFSIWHPESDLFIKNLESGTISKPDINSSQSESFHCWSSDSRWIVFSSRRIDGLFTRLYFSYFDTAGTATKPFILPQKDPGFYATFLKSYNVPELVTSKIDLNPRVLSDIVNSEADTASFIIN